MAIYTGKMSYSVADNPIVDSVYVAQHDLGFNNPPPTSDFMITETGIFMITESTLDLMITE